MQSGDDLGGQQRMPSERKEIVMNTKLLQAQDCSPNVRHCCFHGSPWRLKGAVGIKGLVSGPGSTRRSTLPLGSNGKASSQTMAAGTI